MKKRLIKITAVVCAMTMMLGGTVFATTKMVTKTGSSTVYSSTVSATTNGYSYLLHPYTDSSLTGAVQQGDSGAWKNVTSATVSSEKSYTNSTAGYTTYRLALTAGKGYGTITVN